MTTEDELHARIRDLESANRQHLEFLDLVLSLDNSLVGIRQHKNSAALLAVVAAHVRRLLPIDAVAFFLVQPDFSYQCGFCDPESATADLTARVDREIESGVFAWALRNNRALVRPDGDGALVLHPIATPSRTIGMVACRATAAPEESAPAMNLLSVILSTAAYALENAALYSEVSDRNVHLQRVVDERTRKVRAAQRQIEAASRAKSDFFSMLSHEIRTPLGGITGTAELLLGTTLAPEQREYAETIQRCGQLTLGLLTDILDYTRVEAGRIALESRPFSLAHTLDDVVLVAAEKATSRGVILCAVVDGGLSDSVLGDSHRLSQVLLNLVSNAVKFTERGHVIVAIERDIAALGEVPVLRFSVKDTGRGIPSGSLARIFEPFEQEDASLSRTHGGSGLGLAISQRLVQKMGGQITVESAVGVGSEFSFSLPFPAAPPSADGMGVLPSAALAGHRCLVVDGDPTRRACLVRQLSSWRLEVFACADGPAALERLAGASVPDVIIAAASEADGLAARLAGGRGAAPPLVAIAQPVRPWALHAAVCAAVAPPLDTAAPLARRAPRTPGSGLRVLIVDDNAVNRDVAARMMTRLGAHATTAPGGREAVTMCAQEHYDCVLMDRRMPGVDGPAAVRDIRRDEATRARPHMFIVALTASATDEERDDCLSAGMDAFVTKPFTLEDLAAILDTARAARPAPPPE